MARRPAIFTEADLKRAVRVAKAVGWEVQIMPDGSIRIHPAEGVDETVDAEKEWEL